MKKEHKVEFSLTIEVEADDKENALALALEKAKIEDCYIYVDGEAVN